MYKLNDYIKLNQYDENQVIWRYMNFEKFISLLQNKSLFFSTCFNMQKLDPFEGYYTDINLEKLEREKILNYNFTENERGKPQQYRKTFLNNICINCWHINNIENAAMWKIYASGKYSVALKTTIQNLKKSIKNKKKNGINLCKIQYLNFETDEIKFYYKKYIDDICELVQQENVKKLNEIDIYKKLEKYYYSLIMVKREEYNFENEIRVVSPFVPLDDKNCIKDYGKFIKVDLETLISEIIISPNADDSFVDIVKNAVQTYNLKLDDKKIYKSKLYEKFDN